MTIIMSALVRVSAVSFLNTAPFVYGLQQFSIKHSISLSLDYPSECARKLLSNNVDVGLVPVATFLENPNLNTIGNYCLGSNGIVRTVSLLSHSPLSEIDTIYFDFQSKTSNLLSRVLSKNLWKKDFKWISTGATPNPFNICKNEGMIAIGDKVFDLERQFKYNYDLASEWKKLTTFPFVFAVWASNKELSSEFTAIFNQALEFGLSHINESIKEYKDLKISSNEAFTYLTQNISYNLNQKKREAFELFIKLGKEFSPG